MPIPKTTLINGKPHTVDPSKLVPDKWGRDDIYHYPPSGDDWKISAHDRQSLKIPAEPEPDQAA